MSAHTPGPWQVYVDVPSVDPNWHIVTNASRMRVLANVHIEPGNKVDEANARLIAAAPDLLAAMRFVLAFYEPGQTCLDTNAWKRAEASARAAVAKATGEQS